MTAEKKRPESPEKKATFFSQITYLWFYRVLVKGWRTGLQFEDVYDLEDVDSSKPLMEKFYKSWKPTAEDFCLSSDTEDKTSKGPSLTIAIMKTIGSSIFFATVFRTVSLCSTFAGPFLMRFLLEYVDSPDESQWKGYVLVVCLFCSAEIDALCVQRYLYHTYNFGMRLRTIVTTAVYKKALKLSKSAKRQTMVGEIVNLMSVDAQKLQEVPTFVFSLWSTIVTFVVCVGLLWQTMGMAVLAGVLLLTLLVPFNGFYIGNRIRLSQSKQMIAKDKRIKIFNEVLAGIKVLKLYAWEKIFQDKVSEQRELELESIKWINFMNSVSAVTWNMATYLVCFVIFVAYLLISEENVLNPDKIFFTISIVNVMRYPLSLLSLAVGYLGQDAVQITDGSFSWGKGMSSVLSDISLSVAKGELVAVVGDVGSGKSSLIAAMLGETIKCKGAVKLSGRIAYVPQEAWILSRTLKDNILLDKPHISKRYQTVVNSCTLMPDIATLSHGDQTEIGEKGINLSGGQKQRVSLARAAYQDEDIYLLDDPLSAVDAQVARQLFDDVIGPNGLLKNKTRILVTHNIMCLPQVDKIVVMKDGRISEYGSYEELLLKKEDFPEYFAANLDGEEESTTEKEDDLEQLEKAKYPENGANGSVAGVQEHEGLNLPLNSRFRRASILLGNITERITEKDSFAPGKIMERQHSLKTDQLVQQEKEKQGNISLDVIWSYMKAGGALWVSVIFVFHLFSVVAFVLGSLWLSSWATDAQVLSNTTQLRPNNTYFRLGVYGGYIAIQAFTIKMGSLGIAFGCYHASRSLHSKVLHKIIRAPMMFFDTTPLGRIMNRCSKDLDYADVNIPLILRSWFYMFLPLLSTLFLITYITPIFLAVGVPIIIVFVISQRLYVKSSRQLQRINSVKRSPVFVHFDESIVGASSIRAYNRTDMFVEKCHMLVDDSQKAWYMVLISMRWLGVSMATLGNFVTLFASLFVVLHRDSIGSGLAGLSISYSLQVSVYMYMFVRSTSSLETYLVAVERIQEYTKISSEADWEIPDKKPPENWPEDGKVEFSRYSTKYRPTLNSVVKEVSFSTESSEKVGIVGRTGAGKSSIALSLFRIIEATEGKITIDGVDISQIGLHDLRSKLTVIPQDPVIFSGSLRSNLDPEEKFADSEIWKSLELAHLREFVSGLPLQLEYECGEGGEALSLGQRQLVCLARALLRKSKILVLDEATSGIDLATDDLIQSTIRTVFGNCTVITIAHRLNTIMDYDRIMVLANGSVKEFNPPDILLQNEKSVFYSLAKSAKLC